MREDWISPWWQAMLLPERWDVCGVSVPSLSVWHTFALENVGNLYILGDPAQLPTRDDAYSLLLLARLDMASGRRLMTMPHYRGRQLRRLARKLKRVPWEELDDACRDYVETCTRSAERWNKGGGRPAAVPYQFSLVRCLCADWGMDKEGAWNTPYAVARSQSNATAEFNGDDSIMGIAAQEMSDNWEEHPANTDETYTIPIGIS